MPLHRQNVNNQIVKDINNYWTDDKKAKLLKKIRKGVFLVVGPFEKEIEPKVQEWAHQMIPKVDAFTHSDRIYLKTSIRKYLRKQTIEHLGLQKYFPELFEEDKNGKA
jgi:ubiquinone/menaquinone biosynthesis C-methylase UbiE